MFLIVGSNQFHDACGNDTNICISRRIGAPSFNLEKQTMKANHSRAIKWIASFVFFHLMWWGVLYLGRTLHSEAWQSHLLAMTTVTLLFLIVQYRFVSVNPREDLRLALFAMAIGLLMDAGMFLTGMLQPGPALSAWPPQCQLLVVAVTFAFLWAIFSSTIDTNLGPLRTRLWAFVAACTFFGPLTYIGPEQAGFITYGEPRLATLGLHGILWGVWAFILAKRPPRL